MSELGQGLTLSGIGILVTFGALGALIVLILGLKALFPGRKEGPEESQAEGTAAGNTAALRKRAAAAGVAALLGARVSENSGSLGQVLESPPGAWWRKGLDRIQGKE